MGHETSVDVVFLTYDPNRDIRRPLIKLDTISYAGISELEEHQIQKRREKASIDAASYNHYKWYISCLKLECQKIDTNNNQKLKIQHWSIESSNIEAFQTQGNTYQAVSMIVSPNIEYWYCSNQGPNALPTFGSRLRCTTDNDGKINVADIRYQPPISPQQSQFAKSPKSSKNPTICINNKPECDNCSVMQCIDVLNQKKNILKRNSPQLHDSRKILRPIVEEKN